MSVTVRDDVMTQTAVTPTVAATTAVPAVDSGAAVPDAPDSSVTTPAAPAPQELDFVTPPPGLRRLRHFTLDPIDDAGLLFALRSTEEPGVRLFLVSPQAYFPDYAPRLDGPTRDSLALGDDEATLLVVVHPGRGDEPPTANLMAPVAMNLATGRALQVVLDDDRWPLRAPLTAA